MRPTPVRRKPGRAVRRGRPGDRGGRPLRHGQV